MKSANDHRLLSASARSRRSSRQSTLLRVEALERRDVPSLVPVGATFQVNTINAGFATDAAPVMDAGGNCVIAWGQDSNTDFQRLNIAGVFQGGEVRASTSASAYFDHGIAMDDAGNFVVAYDGADGSADGIFARRFSPAGTPIGDQFQVNTFTTTEQDQPSVAMDASGAFVIAWTSYLQDGSSGGVYAQRYSADGLPQGGEFRVNTFTAGSQSSFAPAIDMDPTGNFVIAWDSRYQDGDGWGVYAQQYAADGTTQGGEFRINTTVVADQSRPALQMGADGGFVIVWQSAGQDTNGDGIYAQRFGPGGVALGGEFRVNSAVTGDQQSPGIGMNSSGNFVVAWMSTTPAGPNTDVNAQSYNALGAPLGAEFRVATHIMPNTYTARPLLAMDAAGDLIATWSARNASGAGWQVFAQRYLENGVQQSPVVYFGADVTVTEGNSGTQAANFTVNLSAPSSQTVSVQIMTANGTAVAGSDYQYVGGTLFFAPGETSLTVAIPVIGDRIGEPTETFSVNLSNPVNAAIGGHAGLGIILDDEPTISIGDVRLLEGAKNTTTSFVFTVTLSSAMSQAVTMSYRTADGPTSGRATAGSDYVAKTGTLTFNPGQTQKTITITVNGDKKAELDESFDVDLFGASTSVFVAKSRGVGTILNDD